jgi:hypothetical protein
MNTRPTFTPPHGIPHAIAARMAEKAAASWCYVTPDGRSFYVDERKARAMLASHGGTVHAPNAMS